MIVLHFPKTAGGTFSGILVDQYGIARYCRLDQRYKGVSSINAVFPDWRKYL